MKRRSRLSPVEPAISITSETAAKVDSAATRWGVQRARVLDVPINLALDKEGAK